MDPLTAEKDEDARECSGGGEKARHPQWQ